MPAYFLDSSALVKGYRLEPGTARVHQILRGSDPLIIAQISHLEVSSAIVRRAQQSGMSDAQILRALHELDREVSRSFEIIRADDPIIASAVTLTRSRRLRAADALQLASALAVRMRRPQLIFVSSDLELNQSAVAEGLSVIDPTQP
jgi:predicted nucleic acid-binding protein